MALAGEFLAGNTQQFLKATDRLEMKPGGELALDMEGVVYIDSAALGCLLALQARLGKNQTSLRLERCGPKLEELLRRINCWDLFRMRKVPPAPQERLEAYSTLGEVLSHKVNLLTILMATAGEITESLEEDYLCRKIVMELSSLLHTEQVYLYLSLVEKPDWNLYAPPKEVLAEGWKGAPEELPADAFDSLRRSQLPGLKTQLVKDRTRLPQALARHLTERGAELVAVSPLVGMHGELGWFIAGVSSQTQLLVEDNLRGMDLFLKIAALLLDNVRSEKERLAEAEQVQTVLGDMSRADEELELYQKACSLEKVLVRLTRRLNNQLVPVLGYTQMLLKTGQMAPIDRNRLERIEESIQGAKRLVGGLIGLTTPPPLAAVRLSLNEVARRAAAQIAKEIEGFRADRLTWDLDENLPETMADFRQCELVFHQIVRNSWEAIQGREDGKIVIRSRGKDCMIEFEISDNGEGMPETTRERAFEPFFTMREQASHLGLGLSLSKSIMELHRGRIDLQSHPESGTKVVLTWPAAAPEDLPQPEPELPEEPGFPRRAKIVVVDDERVCADLVVDVLSEEHDVVVFYEARHAMSYLDRADFDLILSDLRMPGISGMEFYRWVRTRLPGRERNLIFVTGNAFEPEYRTFIESIDNIVIAKPFNLGTFRSLVRLALEQQVA